MLDESRREELIARLESLGDTSDEPTSESAEPAVDETEGQEENRNDAEPVAAEAETTDVEQSEPSEGRQSGAQRRISDLVRQRNEATDQFRELQERFAAMESQLQGYQQQQHVPQEPEQQQAQYYDEYGDPVEYQNPDLMNLRAEFDQYREAQVIEQVKSELEQEIQQAVSAHSNVDGQWLRKQLIDAVRLNGNANVGEVAEYYASFVTELQESAVSQHQASARTPAEAPPRLDGRGAASSQSSRQGDKTFTRDDARRRAYEIITGS